MSKTLVQAPIRANHVGSFLRTERLKQARADFKNNQIDHSALKAVEKEEIKKIVKKQIEVGLKTITDGEFQRSWWNLDFFVGLNGIDKVTVDEGVAFADGTKVRPESYVINKQISGENHPFVEQFKTLQAIVDEVGDGSQVVKFTIPAPGVIMYRTVGELEKEVYPDTKELFRDLGRAYKQVVADLYNAGCHYIQFDETTLTTFTDPGFTSHMIEISGLTKEEILDSIVEATDIALQDKPTDLLTAVHMCRGNFRSRYMHADGDYGYVAPVFPRLNYDAFFLEYDTERSGGFEPLRHLQGTDKIAVIGIFTSKFGELEDADQIKGRIKEATQYLPLEQLAISPQCGFASTEEGNELTEEEQWNKIRHIINIAEEVWN